MEELTQERLKQLLHYDPDTGVFTWIANVNRMARIGDVAGSVNKVYEYVYIQVLKKKYRAHRLAWLYVHGSFPKNEIDHIDHDRLNNRIDNLRDVTRQENKKNTSISSSNTSGFMGVCWDNSVEKWMVTISISGKRKTLGRFTNINDAIEARKAANIKYGYHENHGQAKMRQFFNELRFQKIEERLKKLARCVGQPPTKTCKTNSVG